MDMSNSGKPGFIVKYSQPITAATVIGASQNIFSII